MVSTTLTTIAAGQPTSSSSHRQSSATLAASATNNSNYQRSLQQQQHQTQQQSTQQQHHLSLSTRNNYYYDVSTQNGLSNNNTTKTASTVLQSAVGTTLESSDHSNNPHYYKRPSSSNLYNGKGPSSSSSISQYNSNTLCQAISPTTETAKPDFAAPSSQSLVHIKSPQNVATTAATITTPTVNLSKALLSASPPLNDQISLLFPKCRPKQQHVSNHSNINDSSHQKYSTSDTADLNVKLTNGTENSQVEQEDSLRSAELPITATESLSSPATHYYRTVNIITQSPPPPSTSSVSSESLSSVTPRISTNPFLCPNLPLTSICDDTTDTNKLNEIPESNSIDYDEELPVQTYQAFYYHTSNVDRQEERNSALANSYEMPRKRSSHSNFHYQQQQSGQHLTQLPVSATSSVGNNHHQLQQQQHQQPHNTTAQHQAPITTPTQNQNQNPFTKDNYWETRHNITPASTVLNSPELSGTEADLPCVQPSSRRAYHQQTYNNHYLPRQQQHHIRVGPSPVNQIDQCDPLKRNVDHMHKPQSQSELLNPDVSPNLQATHYHYGRKSSMEQHVVDWEVRERRERESRERDREQREQRVSVVEGERERVRDVNDIAAQQKPPQKQQKTVSAGRLSVISDGEVVVFDDIAESWQSK